MKIHLDTDIGSDIDDACALAMLLGWPGVELTGITTTIDPGGRRAGYVTRCLQLAGQEDIPVAAGAEVSMSTLAMPGSIPDDDRYWQSAVPPHRSSAGAALDLLESSIDQEATLVAIGPYTNLALLAVSRPGRLADVSVVTMGGWVAPPGAGLPPWGPQRDWNVQSDTAAAEVVARSANQLTLVPLAATAKVHLRAAHLARLEAAGPFGRLLASQARLYSSDNKMNELGRQYPGLPDDLLNFQHDPLACAVAAGWDGAAIESMRLSPVYDRECLRFQTDPAGRPAAVVVDVDGSAFADTWLACIEAIGDGH